ncbi:glycosyltransferase family 4 protein [Candidatus Uhrbacteria bacterium]|nr:glycosyltransferase family 4 protein [Candidatus Uhrbacteria bacterium]
MIIGIDLRCLPQDGSPGAGVAHAARELTRVLVYRYPDISWIVYLSNGAVWDRDAELLPYCDVIRLANDSGAALRGALKIMPCQLLFVLSGCVPPGLSIPCVPWVHDVAIFHSGAWFPQSFFRRLMTMQLFLKGLRASQMICAVSESTKKELLEITKLDSEKIVVTYEGGDSFLANLKQTDLVEAKQRAKIRLAQAGVTQSYILWMGTVEPRKNIETVIAAWTQAKVQFSRPVDLVIAGKDGWKLGPIHRALRAADLYAGEGGSRLHRIRSVSEEDKRDLLLGADIVALPSWHEGFGLVALEALQAGVATIVSSEGGMPEIVADAGIILPPTEVSAWAEAFVGLIEDEVSRAEMARLGISRSQGFTWERSARIVYQTLTDTL